jgi:hypothetical protein
MDYIYMYVYEQDATRLIPLSHESVFVGFCDFENKQQLFH